MARVQDDGCVVLCVRSEAMEVPAVVAALRDRWSVEALVLDPTRFPSSHPLTLEYQQGGEYRGHWAQEVVEGRRILAVWQRLCVGAELPFMEEPGVRETCIAASEIALAGFLGGLPAFQLDPYWNIARADNKPYQLRIAQSLGLEIPATLITNDPAAVRAFARQRGPLIMKALVQQVSSKPLGDAERPVIFTTAMTDTDLENLDGLELCPMIFQERISNELEVRVTIVGKQIFSASIDSKARHGSVDWRRQGYADDELPSWSPYELPDDVAGRLLKMLDYFGLNQASADIMVAPDGRHVFLELNAYGSFFYLGPSFTDPIAGAIADVLMDPALRRATGRA